MVDLPSSGRNVWQLAATTPGVLARHHHRHRPVLPRRRPARDPEQPDDGRHQRLVQPAGDDQHAADGRRGHRSPGADRQHVGRVRLLPRRPRQRRHQEPAPTTSTARSFEYLPGRRAREPRLLRQPGAAGAAEAEQPVRRRVRWAGDDSRRSTTAATRRSSWPPTRGSARERTTSPIASVPTERMRRGDFSEIATQIRTPDHQGAVPGQPDPGSRCSPPGAPAAAGTIPLPNLPGTANGTGNNYQAPALTEDNNDQVLLRVDQNITNASRLYVRYNWVDAFDGFGNVVPDDRPVPAARQQEHARLLAADAVADAPQRLPDRLPPARHRHAQQLHA